ncbi:MAG: hypothetical protein ACM359_00565 [Bacillota bacterium]
MNELTCQACGGQMVKAKISSGNFTGIIGALIVLAIGIAITLAIPCIGWVVGPLLILMALGMGGKRQKVWRCQRCRAFIPRM